MAKKKILMLMEGSGIKGKTVIRNLVEDARFMAEYDLSTILDEEGPTSDVLNKLDIPMEITQDTRNPAKSIARSFDGQGYDYLVSCGWGYVIPKDLLGSPEIAALNCHSSYLPDYKGKSVYRPQWAHAERYGGATIHKLSPEIDEGDIITQARFSIGLFDGPRIIAKKYSEISVPLLREAIALLENGYGGRPIEGGRYFSKLSWRRTIAHGIANHMFRALGVGYRWEVPPTVK